MHLLQLFYDTDAKNSQTLLFPSQFLFMLDSAAGSAGRRVGAAPGAPPPAWESPGDQKQLEEPSEESPASPELRLSHLTGSGTLHVSNLAASSRFLTGAGVLPSRELSETPDTVREIPSAPSTALRSV